MVILVIKVKGVYSRLLFIIFLVPGNVEEFQCEDCGKQCENQNYYQDHDCEHQIILNNPQKTAKIEIFDETKKESVTGYISHSKVKKIILLY